MSDGDKSRRVEQTSVSVGHVVMYYPEDMTADDLRDLNEWVDLVMRKLMRRKQAEIDEQEQDQ